MQTIFLIASDKNNPVSENHLYRIFSLLGIDKGSLCTKWIEKEKAIVSILPETFFGGRDKKSSLFSVIDRIEKELAAEKIDFFLLDEKELSPKKLLLCDMDSTIVAGETLDNLAVSMGVQKEVAAITAKAMAGEFAFAESLQKRAVLLEGMAQEEVSKECGKLLYNDGAYHLLQRVREAGVICVLVSGGFLPFTEFVAKELGFHHHHGNTLEFHKGKATGRVVSPILDGSAKLSFLQYYREKYNLKAEEIIAVGDGANDLPMLKEAGLGIGFRPKDILRKNIVNSIRYGGLDTILYLFAEVQLLQP